LCIRLNLEVAITFLDIRDARKILEAHFKQRNPSNETGVEDESFYLTAYIPIVLTGKAVSN